MGLSLKLETQQRARSEVKAHTMWFNSEASILLQRQTTPDDVSHSSLLAYCKQQNSNSCCQEILHDGEEQTPEVLDWEGNRKQILRA